MGHVLEQTWNYNCPILMRLGQAEKLLILSELRAQLSCCKHANQASGELLLCLCLKTIGQVLTKNHMSHF